MKNLTKIIPIILTFMLIGCTDTIPNLQLITGSSTMESSINSRNYSEIIQNLQIAPDGKVWVSGDDEVGYQCIYSIDEGVIKKYKTNTFAYINISSPIAILDNKPYFFQRNYGRIFLSYIENDSIYHLYDPEMNDLNIEEQWNGYIPILISTKNGLFTGDYYYNGKTWKTTELGLSNEYDNFSISKNNYVLGLTQRNQGTLFSYDGNKDISHTYNDYYDIKKLAINNNGQGFVLDQLGASRIYEIDLQTGNSTKIVLPENIVGILSFEVSPNNELVVLVRFHENFVTKNILYNYTTHVTTELANWPDIDNAVMGGNYPNMFMQKNGTIWVHLGNTLRAYKNNLLIEEITDINEFSSSRMFEDDKGYFWFLSSNGEMDAFFRYKDGVFEDYKKYFNKYQ